MMALELYALGALVLLLLAVAAWRPATLQALLTRLVSVLVAPVFHVQQVLATVAEALRRSIRHLAVSEGAPFTGLAIAEHHLGGLAMAGFLVLGVVSEWLLVSLVLAGMFDASPSLPAWLPSWATDAENMMSLGLLCAGTAYGLPLLDVIGQTHVSGWGAAQPAFRRAVAVVCVIGLIGYFAILGLMGWTRGAIATASIGATSGAAGVEVCGPITGAVSPVLLGVALVLAAAVALNVPKTIAMIAAAGIWLLVSVAIVLLGLWNALVNAIHVALLHAVTWAASLFRRDETTRSWVAPAPPAVGAPGYDARPAAAGGGTTPSDAPAAIHHEAAAPMPTEATEEVAPPPPQSERGADDDDPNWRAF